LDVNARYGRRRIAAALPVKKIVLRQLVVPCVSSQNDEIRGVPGTPRIVNGQRGRILTAGNTIR
jgi:hypothetical protein